MHEPNATLTPPSSDTAVETYLSYVPFAQVDLSPAFGFRGDESDRDQALRLSLSRSGQTHPIVLEQHEAERFTVLDGHRRAFAIAAIRATGGDWEKIWAHVVPAGHLPAIARFRLLRDRNFWGDNPYRVAEAARFIRSFADANMPPALIAEELSLPLNEIQAYWELAAARPELAALINDSTLNVGQALQLHLRYEACLRTAYASHALDIARAVVLQADEESPSPEAWTFLLDFYWGKDRPFLPGRLVSF
jgi:ParB-like chromosome segregation protein Spo0J